MIKIQLPYWQPPSSRNVMELPEVRNADSPRDLLRDLGEVYTDNVKLGRDVVYSHILREGVRVIVIREIYFLGCFLSRYFP